MPNRTHSLILLSLVLAFASTYSNANDDAPITPYANLTLETWSLLEGGNASGEKSGALLDFGFDADLQSIANLENTTAHIGFLAYGGNREIDAYTGDFGVFSNLITDTEISLFTAYLAKSFPNRNATLKLGQLSSDESFYVSDHGLLFLNANFGAHPIISANQPAPIYSVGAAGVEFRQDSENGYWQIAAYAGDAGPGDASDHGLNWRAGGSAGYVYLAEIGLNTQLSENLPGTFKLGASHATGEFQTFSSSQTLRGNQSYYAIWDQTLARFSGECSLHAFARYGTAPHENLSPVDRYFDCGLNLTAPLPRRPNDVAGIAFSNTTFSSPYLQSLRDEGSNPSPREKVIELTYLAQLNETWSLQPSAQWILDPHQAADNVFIAGLRLAGGF